MKQEELSKIRAEEMLNSEVVIAQERKLRDKQAEEFTCVSFLLDSFLLMVSGSHLAFALAFECPFFVEYRYIK